jgi:hypothetical protein
MQDYTCTADTQTKKGLNIKKNAKKNQTKIKKQNMHILIAIRVLLQGPNSRPIFRAKTNFMWSFYEYWLS